MTLDAGRLLRDAFGSFMTGVTVVTALSRDGRPLGFTANSFSSVSLDPPLLLVSAARSSRHYETYRRVPSFAVNVLSEDQKDISNTFARPVADRFGTVAWRPGPHGSPILEGASAWFDCSMHRVVEAGDHAILIGRVEAFDSTGRPGLGYYRGGYLTPARTAAAVALGPAVVVGAIIARAGEVVLVGDGAGGLRLPALRAGPDGARATLARVIAATGVEAEPGALYSVYEDTAQGLQHLVFLAQARGGRPAPGAGFVALEPGAYHDVADPAQHVMLRRFAEEARVGSFGLYHGNQDAGRVLRVASEGP
jgi:flavin reductase (DIM6/NTAB) family NADH-FMN oxidoreductase RutF